MFAPGRKLRLPAPPAVLSLPALLVLEKFLNRTLADAIRADELYFLQSRRIRIQITDLCFAFDVSFDGQRLKLQPSRADVDLCISGGSYEYLLLASRREDADTLFFQRRLQTEGDTELGLEVKNFLDGQDLSNKPLLQLLESALGKLVRTIETIRAPRGAYPQ